MFLLIIALIAAGGTVWAFHARGQAETSLANPNDRVTSLVDPFALPLFIIIMLPLTLVLPRSERTNTLYVSWLIALILYISIYYALLLGLLPLLRRIISPRACATLWLLPNFLYLLINFQNLGSTSPLFVITLPRRWLGIIGAVWGIGFLLILFWQIISHLRYRRYLLRSAVPVEEPTVLTQWENEQKRRNVKRMIPVLMSDKTHTPLTIGCFSRTYRLILPHLDYSEKEFALIFQHEMRHIQRLDTRTKAFLGFCAALCWFNPLMWIARRKVSDDLELSCDELVLTNADAATRKHYANLLLDTAGNGKGYTTCLSAAASSMRYRLKNIMKPRKRLSGSIVVAVALFLLIVGSSSFALADSPGTVQSLIFDQAPAGIAIDGVSIYNWSEEVGYRYIYSWEEDPLTAYIASLSVKQVYMGQYSDEGLRQLYVDYAETVDGEVASLTRVELCDGLLWAYIPYDDQGQLVFLVEDEVDWDYIESLLDFDAPNPNPSPQRPEMMLYFNDEINPDDQPIWAESTVLHWEQGGTVQEVGEWMLNDGVGGVFGAPVTQAQLSFSYEPVDGYEVLIENWDRTDSYTVSSTDLTDNTLELAPYSAHYTVTGTFYTVRDTTYEMEFYFDVELPEE